MDKGSGEIYAVNGWNNFCRVFQIPEEFPRKFCFGGGHAVEFLMVDWFYPVPNVSIAAVSKEVWEKEVGPIKETCVYMDDLKEDLIVFLKKKQYIIKGRQYLVLCDFGASFTFHG